MLCRTRLGAVAPRLLPKIRNLAFAAVALMATVSFEAPAIAQSGATLGKSGLPVPRFVSLKSSRVNVRVGPGQDYRVAWIFTRPGLPIEVIQEFDNWRRVRDSEGEVGWVFHSLLSGKRTGVVAPWGLDEPLIARARPESGARIVAYLESGVMVDVRACEADWCRVRGEGFDGWVNQEALWGVYPDELID